MAIRAVHRKALKQLGLNLRALRESKGWTLEHTEEMGWPNWNHLQRIESGKKDITFSTILRLARLYRVSISQIFKDIIK